MTYDRLTELARVYRTALSVFAEGLSIAHDEYQEMVGEGINTWRDFVEQPEIGLTVREANQLIKLSKWESLAGVPLTYLNLSTAKFAANKGVLDAGLLDDMKVLSLKDWKERHYDVEQKQDNAPRTYEYMVMKRCKETGSLQRVYGEELEEAKDKV